MLHPEDLDLWLDTYNASLAGGAASESKSRFRNAVSGEYRWRLNRIAPLRDGKGLLTGWLGTSTDIDDLENLTRRLEQTVDDRTRELNDSLIEKTTLLKEVHHRVKNNLQVVCSLLSMQLDTAGGDSISSPIHDAHRRVLAMSLIHERKRTVNTVPLNQAA